MKELTFKEMEDILLAHEKAELEQDIEATMATVSPNPHYEFPTFGLQADGRDAVREHYRRALGYSGNSGEAFNVAAEKRVHAAGPNTLIREAWATFTLDGKRQTGMYLAVITFDPETKLISGERLYTDDNFAKVIRTDMGPDFEAIPGISRIDSTAPIIDVHDAYAQAAAQGITINAPTS